jgi:peroxiredoxin family protein
MTPATIDAPVPPDATRSRAPIEHLAIICSKGTLDMFTFWGLDIITKKTVDHLHVPTVGNPSMHIPTMVGGLPGMESFATTMMLKQMERLDIPPVHEMLEILGDSGAHLYACKMAMEMFKRTKEDLVPQVEDVITAMDFFDKAAGAQVLFI